MISKDELIEILVNYVAGVMRPYRRIKKSGGLLFYKDLDKAEERCYGAIDAFFDALDLGIGLTKEEEEEIDEYWDFIQSEFNALRRD